MSKTLENIAKWRGVYPVILSQIVNPGVEGCGWCGWIPPQDDILGALAYCTQKGLACPSCRMSEWHRGVPFTVEDMLEDAYLRGDDPLVAYQYAISWGRYKEEAFSLRDLAKKMLRLKKVKVGKAVEKKIFPSPAIFKDGKEFTTWGDPRIWTLREGRKKQAILLLRGSNFWRRVCQKLGLDFRQPFLNGERVRKREIILGEVTASLKAMVEKNPNGGWDTTVWIEPEELKPYLPLRIESGEKEDYLSDFFELKGKKGEARNVKVDQS